MQRVRTGAVKKSAGNCGKHFKTGIVLLVASLLFFLFSNSYCLESPVAKNSEILKLFYWQAPTVFNPHFSTAAKDREACRITYDPQSGELDVQA